MANFYTEVPELKYHLNLSLIHIPMVVDTYYFLHKCQN